MKTLSCAHTHTVYCDGKNTPWDMALSALEKGFVSLGYSSHAPQDFDFPYCMPLEKEEAYKAEIRAVQKAYADRMAVYMGIERDRYACVSPEGYDYFIASVHYLKTEEGYGVIDGAPEDLKDYVDRHCGGNGLEMVRRYYELLGEYVLSSKAPIIGHYDLVRKNNASLRLFDEDSPAYRQMALDHLRPLAGSGALLEVNTGAMARGYLPTPYPAPFLLSAWREWGGEVILGSDCHDRRFLTAYYDEAEALLLSLGYDHAVRLGRERLWERYSLK